MESRLLSASLAPAPCWSRLYRTEHGYLDLICRQDGEKQRLEGQAYTLSGEPAPCGSSLIVRGQGREQRVTLAANGLFQLELGDSGLSQVSWHLNVPN